MPDKVRAAVVGCGLIGKRRASEAAQHADSALVAVADTNAAAASAVTAEFACRHAARWQDVVVDPEVDVVIVSTPNAFLAEIAVAALRAGKSVLLEKPMGRTLEEARAIARAARDAGRLVKVGFNHRYHPAIRRARELLAAGAIGTPVNLRIRYGHGGRSGYEKEWRGNAELAGGGELTDQGVHALDLIHCFAGPPSEVAAMLQTAVWPIAPLEDNGFAILRCGSGIIASIHTSWTQWKNLFSLELFGDRGALIVEGLGGSYGTETLHVHERAMQGGAPSIRTERFEGADESWKAEWAEFVRALREGTLYDGGPNDGLVVMAALDALYRSARSGSFSAPEAVD
jgi:predicted dehydrogenase